MQKSLFKNKAETLIAGKRTFRAVTFDDLSIFQEFNLQRERIVQFVSSNYMLHYWNCGNYRLFINEDWEATGELIPIARKYKNVPQYFIVAPIVEDSATLSLICKDLEKLTAKSVRIRYMIPEEAELVNFGDFSIRRQGDKEYINNLEEQVQLSGSKFKRLRQAIRHGQRQNPNIVFKIMEPSDTERVEKFLRNWMDARRENYFRPSIGNDINQINLFNQDLGHTFCLLALDGEDVASVYMEAGEPGTEYSCCTLAKTLPQYTDLSYWTFLEAKKEALSRGFKIENIGMSSSPGGKAYKMRWNPFDTYRFYEAIYLGANDEN